MQAGLRNLRSAFVNPLARMLPLFRWQSQVYRMAESGPPPGLEGFQPRWEPVDITLGPLQTYQARVDLLPGFHLLAMLASSSVNTQGGFRAQVRDQNARVRLGNRGIQFPNIAGGSKAPYFCREPYEFLGPRPQALVILQNLEDANNAIELVLYGAGYPFTGHLE